MTNIKAFNDGSRFCIVIENCDENLRAKLIKELKPELIEDLEAKAVEFKEERATEVKQEKKLDEAIANKIVSSSQILAAQTQPNGQTDEAFRILSSNYNLLPEQYKEITSEMLRSYLCRRFKDVDIKAFLNLADKQYRTFFYIFGHSIGDGLWKHASIKNEEDFFASETSIKNAFITNVIKCFKSIEL